MMMRWFLVAFLNKQLCAKPLPKARTNRHEYDAYISQPSVHNDMDLDQHEYASLADMRIRCTIGLSANRSARLRIHDYQPPTICHGRTMNMHDCVQAIAPLFNDLATRPRRTA